MRTNEIQADQVFTRTSTVVAVTMVLCAPCTFGASLFGLLWIPLVRWIQTRRVESCIAGADARAWSIAGLTVSGVTHDGVLWVAGDELFFAARWYRGSWPLASLRDLTLERTIGPLRGLRWFQGRDLVQVSVPDVHGWHRVLQGRTSAGL